ncbi:MAG: hypothetical protein ACOC6R_03855 [Chloroflexota bacterium]
MKVRELQEQLSKLDPELDVMCYSEDKGLLVEGRSLILFDVIAVSRAEAEQLRLANGTLYLRFERGPKSAAIATLEVTSEF